MVTTQSKWCSEKIGTRVYGPVNPRLFIYMLSFKKNQTRVREDDRLSPDGLSLKIRTDRLTTETKVCIYGRTLKNTSGKSWKNEFDYKNRRIDYWNWRLYYGRTLKNEHWLRVHRGRMGCPTIINLVRCTGNLVRRRRDQSMKNITVADTCKKQTKGRTI